MDLCLDTRCRAIIGGGIGGYVVPAFKVNVTDSCTDGYTVTARNLLRNFTCSERAPGMLQSNKSFVSQGLASDLWEVFIAV